MFRHQFRCLGGVAVEYCGNDVEMFAAPIPHTAAVGIAAELQKASQSVLLLDSLKKENIAAEARNHFVKLRVRIKE